MGIINLGNHIQLNNELGLVKDFVPSAIYLNDIRANPYIDKNR